MFRTMLAGAVALAGCALVACSSSSSGGATAGDSSTHRPSTSGGGAGAASIGAGGKDANAWCREIDNSAATMLNGRSDPTSSLSAQEKQTVQRLAADAPGAIRSDVQTLVHYEFALAAGKTSDPSTQHYFAAATHVMQWLQTNCPTVFHKLNPGVVVSSAPSLGSS